MLSTENPFGWVNWTNDWSRPGREKFKTDNTKKPFTDYEDRPFDFDAFFGFFPEFNPATSTENPPPYTLAFLGAVAKRAGMFIKPSWCRELDGEDRKYAFFLMVAHMSVLAKSGQTTLPGTSTPGGVSTSGMTSGPGVVVSSSVGGVSISKGQMAPIKRFWEEWYYQTPYGREYLTFLEQQVAAGIMYEGEENIADCLRD